MKPPHADPRAWRADTLDPPARWYHPLSAACLDALDGAVRSWRREPRPVTEVRAPAPLRELLAAELRCETDAVETVGDDLPDRLLGSLDCAGPDDGRHRQA